MKLLFTGANGFLGKNVIPLLQKKGFNVTTLGLTNGDYICDISNTIPEFLEKFDVVFHAAGKAHRIPKTEEDIKSFFDINFEGTKNLCAALEKGTLPEHFIFISTVAVYGVESGELICENQDLNGKTPYSKSKILAEQFLLDWTKKNNVKLTILRPSLIAGKNAIGNLGDMVKAIKTNRYFNIAGGKAKKSILWVNDFAEITNLAVKKHGGVYNVCDSVNPTFYDISKRIAALLNKDTPKSIPLILAKALGLIGDLLGNNAPINSLKLEKMIKPLTFSNSKIREELNWNPTNVLENLEI